MNPDTPLDWKRVKLNQLLLDIKNGTTQEQVNYKTSFPVTRIKTISEGYIESSNVGYLENTKDGDNVKYRLKCGDILFSHINSINHIGKTALYNGNPDILYHGMNLLRLRPNKEKILPEFLFLTLRLEQIRNRIKSLAKRAINQASINTKEVGSIWINIPPVIEQCGIAEVSSTVDEFINYSNLIIEKIEQLKKGLKQKLLAEDIEHIPKTWKKQKLSNLVTYKNGIYKPAEFYGKGYPSIRMHNIVDGKVVFDGAPLLKVNEAELEQFGLYGGDIVVNRVNSLDLVGKCGIVEKDLGPATFESKNIRLRVTDKNILPEFLNFFLNTEKKQYQIRRYAKAAVSQATITQEDLGKLMISIPPIEEQIQIVKLLTTVQEKIENEQKIREQVIDLKEGLMQVLLYGKIRVELREDGLHRIRNS